MSEEGGRAGVAVPTQGVGGDGGRPGSSSGKRLKSMNNSVMPFPDFENTPQGSKRPMSAVIAGRIVRGPASPRHSRGPSTRDDGDSHSDSHDGGGGGGDQGSGSVGPSTVSRPRNAGSASATARGSYSTNKQNTKKKDKGKDPLNVSGVASMLAEKRQETLAKELAAATTAAGVQHVTSVKALMGTPGSGGVGGGGGGADGVVERDTDGDVDMETPRTGRVQEGGGGSRIEGGGRISGGDREERDETAYLSDQKKKSSRDGLAYKEKMLRKELKRMGVGVGAGTAH
jgi:hypothetical protein